MDLNRIKTNKNEDILYEQKKLKDYKSFVESASSIYLDLVKKSNFMPYIQATELAKQKALNCFDILISDLNKDDEKVATIKNLQQKVDNYAETINLIENTKIYIQKASDAYYNYITSTSVNEYAKQIAQDKETIIAELDYYLDIYQKEYNDAWQNLETLQKSGKNSIENLNA